MNTTHVFTFLAKGPPKRPKTVQVPAGEELERCFQQAGLGTRQLVFVSGEAGVGKTNVVDLLQARLAAATGERVARGQCVEHAGAAAESAGMGVQLAATVAPHERTAGGASFRSK